MQGSPEAHAEVLRIANLMGVGEEDLAFLEPLSAEALYEFRQQLIEIYFEENPALKRFAKLAGVMPSAVIAKLTVDAIGPVLSARVVGEVDTKTAINVLKRVSIDFLCDTAIQADPRRIKPLFSESPTDIAKEIADELVRRKEYVAIGVLIAFVENEVMEHALQNASDIDVLFSSFMVEEKDRLADGISMLSDERLASIIHTAADEGMWLEALDLMSHLETDEFRRVASQAMSLDKKTLGAMLEFATDNELLYIMAPAICLADDPTRAIETLLATTPKLKKALLAEFDGADYSDELTELLEKYDTPELRKYLKPVLA